DLCPAFPVPPLVHPSTGKHRNGKRDISHELFGIPEGRPEWHSSVEPIKESSVLSQRQPQSDPSDHDEDSQVRTSYPCHQRQPEDWQADIQTFSPETSHVLIGGLSPEECVGNLQVQKILDRTRTNKQPEQAERMGGPQHRLIMERF